MKSQAQQTNRYGVIIPVCNEAECLRAVIGELKEVLPEEQYLIAVGVNDSRDGSAEVAAAQQVFVGQTEERGYGHGCMAAIQALQDAGEEVDAYIFYAGDGASRPQDVMALVRRFEVRAVPLVIGLRRFELFTWGQEFGRALPNLLLGIAGLFLTGRFHHDLGPLRLIETDFFQILNLREMTWGWTIEAEVKASRLGVSVDTIPVIERPRIGGRQKVSGVSLRQSVRIGWHILAAGIRTCCDKQRDWKAMGDENASQD